MTIGFGIVGCGMISTFHARAIADVMGAKLEACFDTRGEAAEKFAKANGCRAYTDLNKMLADPKVEIVTVATPSGAHMEPAAAAARAGKHVIVEKPLEITLKKCDRMIEACEKAKVKLGAIFPSRFHDSSVKLKKAIEGGRFGKLTLGDAYVKWFRTQEYYDSGAWRGTWALDGGGALMNQAIHSVDLLTWLMGPVLEIQANTATLAHARIEVEDVVVATLRFANGAIGVLEATTAATLTLT
jgi:predicted dehydrogenase